MEKYPLTKPGCRKSAERVTSKLFDGRNVNIQRAIVTGNAGPDLTIRQVAGK
jgi:hypothetical protein